MKIGSGQARILGALTSLVAAGLSLAAGGDRLTVDSVDDRGWPRFSVASVSNRVVRLEASSDLRIWTEVARGHDGLEGYPDAGGAGLGARFYRAAFTPRGAVDDWKNQIRYPDDGLLSPAPGYGETAARWIKFAIDLEEPDRVYFQDSSKYPFHYDFARARLERFRSMSREQFDAVSLRRASQQIVLGAVLYAPLGSLGEFGIQVVGQDPYPPEDVARWIERVQSVLVRPASVPVFYFPTFEQETVAQENREYFEARKITVSTAARWVVADECYAAGWALGRLVSMPARDVAAAYREGRLGPGDLLLIDAVPAEVPPVAGLISMVPATPNSHVAILARSFGVPFVHLADAAQREAVQAMAGKEVVLRAETTYGGSAVRVVCVEDQMPAAVRSELLALKKVRPLDLAPKQRLGRYGVSAEGLRPADVGIVGGKAANFGLLRRSIPASAPNPAMALTFDLWDDYLDQALQGGGTLRDRIAEALGGFTWPPDMRALTTALSDVRRLITDVADFAPSQRAAVLGLLADAGLTADRKIRFRSSTNVEDSERFSGAGLYDSYSGCLADDLDGDDIGPSACDPWEPAERGVFRALRKVYASFYNDNAFLERLRHGVEESAVGMAVLVHHSTPDAIEMANGVATLHVTKSATPDYRWVSATLVTQAGALSVANPESSAAPEQVTASLWGTGDPYLQVERRSALLPLGDFVLTWESEYRELVGLLDRAARAYEGEFPNRREFVLDFEYKKVAPEGRLLVKQIREIPQTVQTAPIVPWLIHETNRYVLSQGEYGDLLGFHRLKSLWTLRTRTVRLLDANLVEPCYETLDAELMDGLVPLRFGGAPSSLPGFSHRREGDEVVDAWRVGMGVGSRTFALRTWFSRQSDPAKNPVVFLGDGRVQLEVTYSEPQPVLGYEGPTTTLSDSAILVPVQPVTPLSLLQTRSLQGKGIAIETRFYWPPPPTGPSAGYTAPVQAWVETTVTGLTSAPLRLAGDFSQTYHPGHHNFYEEFLFDPHLEPGIDPALLAELVGKGIRAICVGSSYGQDSTFWILGWDGKLRRW